jgi:hypothetical protein
MTDELETKLWELFEPLALRIRKGERISRPNWVEVDALREQYKKAAAVLEPYLPTYDQITTVRSQFSPFVLAALSPYKHGTQPYEQVRLFGVERIMKLKQIQEDVLAAVREGKPFDAKKFPDPRPLFEQFKKEVTDFAKTVKP